MSMQILLPSRNAMEKKMRKNKQWNPHQTILYSQAIFLSI